MLSETAEELCARAERLRLLQAENVNADTVFKRTAALEDAIRTLREAIILLSVWKAVPPKRLPKARKIINRTKATQKLLTESINGAVDSLTELGNSVNDVTSGLRAALSSTWMRFTQEHIPVGYDTALAAIRDDPAQMLTATRIERRVGELNRLRSASPPTLETYNAFMAAVEDLQKLLRTVDTNAVPHEVRAFFDAVRSGNATLNHLPETVLRWLKEHDLTQNYTVRSSDR